MIYIKVSQISYENYTQYNTLNCHMQCFKYSFINIIKTFIFLTECIISAKIKYLLSSIGINALTLKCPLHCLSEIVYKQTLNPC